MPAIQLEGKPSAERHPEQVHSAQAERRDERGKAIREVRERKRLRRIR
jgi:hypothetical protein